MIYKKSQEGDPPPSEQNDLVGRRAHHNGRTNHEEWTGRDVQEGTPLQPRSGKAPPTWMGGKGISMGDCLVFKRF